MKVCSRHHHDIDHARRLCYYERGMLEDDQPNSISSLWSLSSSRMRPIGDFKRRRVEHVEEENVDT